MRNSELTKQTVDRKQMFTPIPLISSVYVLLKAYYDRQRNSRSLGAEKFPYIYTASKNYMQIGFFVILYRFLNQCFGNLAPGIVTFVSAYMQNFMSISATINKR